MQPKRFRYQKILFFPQREFDTRGIFQVAMGFHLAAVAYNLVRVREMVIEATRRGSERQNELLRSAEAIEALLRVQYRKAGVVLSPKGLSPQPARNAKITWGNSKRSLSLERDKSGYYFIVRHNVRTYVSEGVVQVIKGRAEAEKAVKHWQDSQSSADHHEGWRYFYEHTNLSTAIEPAEATKLRQTQLENRESEHSAE